MKTYGKTGSILDRTPEEAAAHLCELQTLSLRTLRRYQAVNAAFLAEAVEKFKAADESERQVAERRLLEFLARAEDYQKAILTK